LVYFIARRIFLDEIHQLLASIRVFVLKRTNRRIIVGEHLLLSIGIFGNLLENMLCCSILFSFEKLDGRLPLNLIINQRI